MTMTGPGRTLYVSDLDDTLLGTEGTLSDTARSTLAGVIADGAAFTVATARSPLTTFSALQGVPLALPLVTYGGATAVDPAPVIAEAPPPRAIAPARSRATPAPRKKP